MLSCFVGVVVVVVRGCVIGDIGVAVAGVAVVGGVACVVVMVAS